ncbi:MAG TPA: hypothetical protein VKE42_07135 [Candidatus Cybelea sp.]|nr:hypothetical protein [Candidatus Cybelea sp.]
MVINVTAASDISRSLVTATLHEADAIWRIAGFRFIWERNAAMTTKDSLHVVIGGGASPPTRNVPLAWIGFTESGEPSSMIYVSHANAVAYLANSRETVGLADTMTVLQRETYLARAMGRALAHEIGHFLLASPAHTAKGLMMASHTSTEFFYAERGAFGITASERRQMAARFTSIYLASRG